jgi:hypothetical protein
MVENAMQISAVGNDHPFDALTVSLGSTGSLWEGLRLIGEFLASYIWPFSGGPRPNALPTSMIRPCLPVNDEGACDAGAKVQFSGFTAQANGCGGASGIKVPESFGWARWRWACDTHDRCYSNCSLSKPLCDHNLGKDIAQECRTAYPGLWQTLPRRHCYAYANTYESAVIKLGMPYWLQAQKEGCRCCGSCEPGSTPCGTQCCQVGETCCDGRCIGLEQCCAENQIFCAGQCIDPRYRQCCQNAAGQFICGGHQTCCGNGTCCDAGSTCCEKDGVRSCVPLSNRNCNFQCTECGTLQHCCPSAWGSSFGCCGPTERCDPRHGCVRRF